MWLKNLFFCYSAIAVVLNLYWAVQILRLRKKAHSVHREPVTERVKQLMAYSKYSMYIFSIMFLAYQFWGK
jgi:uncharacterized membrane protein YecN with MAPEG domain